MFPCKEDGSEEIGVPGTLVVDVISSITPLKQSQGNKCIFLNCLDGLNAKSIDDANAHASFVWSVGSFIFDKYNKGGNN